MIDIAGIAEDHRERKKAIQSYPTFQENMLTAIAEQLKRIADCMEADSLDRLALGQAHREAAGA